MRRSLTILVLLLTAIVPCRLSDAEEISGELVGLNVSLAAEKQLVVHDQLVAAEEWAAALDVLDRLKVDSGDVLVKVAPGRYIGLPVAIQQKLCRLPAAGRDVFQKRGDAIALAVLHRARQSRDEAALWQILEESSATSAAPDAVQELAGHAAMRGEFELARRLWGRLIESNDLTRSVFPSPMIPLPAVDNRISRTALIKTVVARHAVGAPLSHVEMTTVGHGEAADWTLGGQSIRDLLIATETPHQSTTTLGPLRWTARATANCPLPEHQTPLSIQSCRGGLLLLNNGQQVRALNEQTGEPFWASGSPEDVGVVFDDSLVDDELNRDFPCRIAGGICSSDRYFGVLGDSPRWRPRPGLMPLAGSLIALDLAQGQGRVLWRVESRSLPEPEWQFHGQPALAPGAWPSEALVIVPLCRPAPQVELAVAAFSQDDGHLVWWTRCGTCAAEPGQPLPETQLLSCGGLVVARTLSGVVVAVDARRGQIQWASTSMVDSPPARQGSFAPLIAARAGILVVADPIQSQVAGFSLDSGEQLWQMLLPFPVQGVVCPRHGPVLIAGTRLRAVSLRHGTPLWEHGLDDPAAAGTGVPVVDGPNAIWPTRTAIWGLDLDRGAIQFQRVLSSGPNTVPIQLVRADSQWCLSWPDAVMCLKQVPLE